MQIVIDIDEDVYTRLFDNGVPTSLADGIVIDRAIRTGKVLPKHGRMIDADELKKIIQENDVLYMRGFNVRLCDIDNTPTIIEAFKAESEVRNEIGN